MDKTEEVLTRSVAKILPDKNALAKLMAGKKIRVYLGIDPTGPKLHLGHTIPLRKLQAFAELGHEAILVMGTGTVLAGDPSQRKEARKKITPKEIGENIKDWKRQASKVLNFDKIIVKKNGDWLSDIKIPELLNIASNISAFQLIKRDMFQDRNIRGDMIGTHEILYPLLQGYDSVHLDVDLEIGGTDQTFNMLMGRELQKKMKDREKFILTTPLISGTDGKQMTKTAGNCIWLDDSPQEMYGKIMSMVDNQIEEYWTNLTDLPKGKMTDSKPLDAKKHLAHEIVSIYHSKSIAEEAQNQFESLFQNKSGSETIETLALEAGNIELPEFLVENNFASSKSEAKRLIKEGAVEVDGQTLGEQEFEFSDNQVLRVGKKKFVRIKIGR